MGNRVVKENVMSGEKEIYVRDAQGNVLTIYEIKKSNTVDSLFTKEYVIYGSARLGYMQDKTYIGKKTYGRTIGGAAINITNPAISLLNPLPLPGTTTLTPIYFGNKRYELNDWLGNVRVVVNDRKTPVNTGNTTVSYLPQIISVSDYYSFGSEISERTHHYTYRYSFNGKEDLREQRWYQDYGARFYNKVLGRFVSADPLIVKKHQYPFYSPYQFAGNKPIVAIDLDGLEEKIVVQNNPYVQKLVIKSVGEKWIKNIVSGYYRESKNGPGSYHGAIDISVPEGTDVHAVAGGKVIYKGSEYNGYGNMIIIEHGEGAYTLYAHLLEINVDINKTVEDNEIIGKSGKSGGNYPPHLHVEIIKTKENANPAEVVGSKGEKNKSKTRINPIGSQTKNPETGQSVEYWFKKNRPNATYKEPSKEDINVLDKILNNKDKDKK